MGRSLHRRQGSSRTMTTKGKLEEKTDSACGGNMLRLLLASLAALPAFYVIAMTGDWFTCIDAWIHRMLWPTNYTADARSGTSDAQDDTMVAKATSMAVLGIASLTLGLVPLKLASWLHWGRHDHRHHHHNSESAVAALHSHGPPAGGSVLSALLCFGGGVLMCTTFLHMLPEVSESFLNLGKTGVVSETWSQMAPHLLMCTGFFVMYLVEEMVHFYLHRRSTTEGEKSGAPGPMSRNLAEVGAADSNQVRRAPIKTLTWGAEDSKPSAVMLEYEDGTKYKSMVPEEYRVSAVMFSNTVGARGAVAKQVMTVDAESPACVELPRVSKVSAKCHKVHHDVEHSGLELDGNLPQFMAGANHHSHVIPTKDEPPVEDSVVTAIRGLLIVLALSVHELFEGLAVGLEGSAPHVWYMLTAVACHKLVIAFCIGVELVAMKTKVPLHVLYVATFALVSPLGIGVGILVTAQYGSVEGGLVPAILQGLATGTLLYVVFFEILERQRSGGHSGLMKYVAVLVGFLVMFGMTFIGGHGHSHHHVHEDGHEAELEQDADHHGHIHGAFHTH